MPLALCAPKEVATQLAARMMKLRLARDLKRVTLAERAGLSASTIKRFEQTGQITLDNLLKLAMTLGCLDQFAGIFAAPPATSLAELERRVAVPERKRGRR